MNFCGDQLEAELSAKNSVALAIYKGVRQVAICHVIQLSVFFIFGNNRHYSLKSQAMHLFFIISIVIEHTTRFKSIKTRK